MTDAFYITMHKGGQAAADALGVDLLFQGAPKFDPERQVSVLDDDLFHRVEHMAENRALFGAIIAKRTQKPLIFGCVILFIGI